MTTENGSVLEKNAPWKSQIIYGSPNREEVLIQAGELSRRMSEEHHRTHTPQVIPQRGPNEWKEFEREIIKGNGNRLAVLHSKLDSLFRRMKTAVNQ